MRIKNFIVHSPACEKSSADFETKAEVVLVFFDLVFFTFFVPFLAADFFVFLTLFAFDLLVF